MVTENLVGLATFNCPNCKGDDFIFSGLQKGYGYTPDMELWTCRRCHSTFSDRFLGVKDEAGATA